MPFTLIPSDPLGKSVLPIPAALDSVGLEILDPQEGTLPPGTIARVLLNYKLRLLPGHFDLLVARE